MTAPLHEMDLGQLEAADVQQLIEMDPMALTEEDELETILGAWNEATIRLEKTHEALREEVQRLTNELEIKNRQLARKDRLADLGQMASHVAHEVRNNLVPVTLYMSMLKRHLVDDQNGQNILDKIEAGFSALDVTVNDLLHFTSDREPLLVDVPVGTLACDVCESLLPQFAAQNIEAEVDVTDALTVRADRDMLRRAVLNLVLNALDVMPHGGRLEITARQVDGTMRLTVADSGVGFSDDSLRHAFEPFFTTKHNGTGLGLAIVYRVADAHHGMIDIANRPEGGAAITIVVPMH